MSTKLRKGELLHPDQSRGVMLEADLEPVRMPPAPRILVIDIETAPIELLGWKIWEENFSVDQIGQDWSILSYAAKWVGERKVIFEQTGGRGAAKVRNDDILMPGLWRLMNEAQIVVAQNGKRFDIRKINYRLIRAGLTPYSPVRVIDTLTESRKLFAATSHKLAYMSEHLTDTPKDKHKRFPGFELWLECLKDNPAAWAEMRKYNIRDILATEKLYLRMRPWIANHPNLGAYNKEAGGNCPKCGSVKLRHTGHITMQVGVYAEYQCRSCGGWSRGKEMLNPKAVRASKMV